MLITFRRFNLVLLPILLWFGPRTVAGPTGPTLQLDYGQGEPRTNGVREFMYFVPLIASEPVTVRVSPENSQGVRVLSFSCRTNKTTFAAACEFEFIGAGTLENIFDHSGLIQRRMDKLQAGETLTKQLGAITVSGPGFGVVEVKGKRTNDMLSADWVRLRFEARGHTSPVSITLEDIAWRDNAAHIEHEVVARIKSLTFERTTNAPKMEVALDSIKNKSASESGWQNFIGGIKGSLANLFIPPLKIQAEGQQAMLDFGQALAMRAPTFSFPHARRLQADANFTNRIPAEKITPPAPETQK